MFFSETVPRISLISDDAPFQKEKLFEYVCPGKYFNEKCLKLNASMVDDQGLKNGNASRHNISHSKLFSPNLPKFKVFGQLFKFESLNFSDF